MTRIKIYKEEVPNNRPCHVWIENNYKLIDKMNKLTPKHDGKQLTRLKLDFDTDQLLLDIKKQHTNTNGGAGLIKIVVLDI